MSRTLQRSTRASADIATPCVSSANEAPIEETAQTAEDPGINLDELFDSEGEVGVGEVEMGEGGGDEEGVHGGAGGESQDLRYSERPLNPIA